MMQDEEDKNLHKRTFLDFLDQDMGHGGYMDKVRNMINKEQRRLLIDLNDLRNFDADLARNFINHPSEYLPAFEEALKEVVANVDASAMKEASADLDYNIGVEGSFGSHMVSPRGLRCHLLSSLVCVEGIVTKCSLVRPKVVRSTHYCQETQQFTHQSYRDHTSMTGMPTGSSYPTKDQDGNLLQTEYGLCVYKDHQGLTIQERPETAPAGQLPRSVDVLIDNDLVDTCKPGDRVHLIGIYRAMPGKNNTSGMYRTLILGNNLRQLSKEVKEPTYQAGDVTNIKKLSKRADVMDVLANSLAPSIYGHSYVKKALLLMLMGGIEKNLPNGTHLRGDINVLMVGDPSTAKSQLLRYVLNIAPLAVNTTGRGSSGVGLTAAVNTDTETGEKRLEAGAMVLADRGVCCIDEFDKMTDADRVAIHEVMEQQTVTIAKAGIHASLNARCSVVAAANPIYGQYDVNRPPMVNIGLPDSLLSRFDLLFIVLDKKEPDIDRSISDHVLRMHRYRKPGQEEAEPMGGGDVIEDTHEEEADQAEKPMYVKYNPLLHAVSDTVRPRHGKTAAREILSSDFIKKYVHYAKVRCQPHITEEAVAHIAENYADLRNKQVDDTRTLPITARTLETLIRLSVAHAKCHLSPVVREYDTEAALNILKFALFHEEVRSKKTAEGEGEEGSADSGKGGGGGDDDDDDEDDDDSPPKGRKPKAPSPTSSKKKRPAQSPQPPPPKASEPSVPSSISKKQRKSPAATAGPATAAGRSGAVVDVEGFEGDVDPERAARVHEALNTILDGRRRDECSVEELIDEVNKKLPRGVERFREPEVKKILQDLEDANKVMVREDTIYTI